MSGILNICRNLLSPPTCLSCGALIAFPRFIDAVSPLCPTCLSAYQSAGQLLCNKCSKEVSTCDCPTEMMKKSGVVASLKLNYYDTTEINVQDKLLYRIKQYPDARAFDFCTAVLAERLQKYSAENGFDISSAVLCFLPRSNKAVRLNGFDQSQKIAKKLSQKVGVPLSFAVARFADRNAQQKSLTPNQRLENAKKSFYLKMDKLDEIKGKNVILLDDMVTTGAGMATVGKMLLKNGALSVTALALSESVYNRDFHEKGN